MKRLVADVLKLNEQLLVCDEDYRDTLIARIEDLLREATLEDLIAIRDQELYIASGYDRRHQDLADYYFDMVELEESLSNEDL